MDDKTAASRSQTRSLRVKESTDVLVQIVHRAELATRWVAQCHHVVGVSRVGLSNPSDRYAKLEQAQQLTEQIKVRVRDACSLTGLGQPDSVRAILSDVTGMEMAVRYLCNEAGLHTNDAAWDRISQYI